MEEIIDYPVSIWESKEDKVFYVDIFMNGEYIECATYGEDYKDAVSMAKDYVASYFIDNEKNSRELPVIPDTSVFPVGKNILYLDIWLPYYKSLMKQNFQRVNVTVPSWLVSLAKERKLNMSQLLTDKIKEDLGI